MVLGLVVWTRRLLFRMGALPRESAPVPVIVVGNIVAGGSGKTPLVLWLAEFLRAQGRTPVIVSRGYGARIKSPREVTPGSDPRDVGDEPLLLARRSGCPVWVSPDRAAAVRAACDRHPNCDVALLDDGLQHYRLRRDIEIAVVDRRGFGNGWLMPAGPLREPPSRLADVDAVVSHEAPVRGYAMRLTGAEAYRLDAPDRRTPLADFAGRPVHGVAGIGEPARFFDALRRAGLDVIEHPFPDHHAFSPSDLAFGDDLPVLMTEKDAVKFPPNRHSQWWVLPVTADIEPAFGDWLLNRLAALGEVRRPT